jgi:hypothetical protein
MCTEQRQLQWALGLGAGSSNETSSDRLRAVI